MDNTGAGDKITAAVLQWEGMSAVPHRFGGTEYRYGTREIGHVHGDHLVDIPFPMAVRQELVAAGKAEPHHILPDSGWVSFRIHHAEDVNSALRLLQQSYDLAVNQRRKRS
jgi:hypothetical protein